MPTQPRPHWEIALRDAIAAEMAAVAERDLGFPGLQEPLGGLIDILGCSHPARELGRRRLVRELNCDALNLAARKWLPADWDSSDKLHVLSLMLWGVWEASTVPDYWETLDIAGEQIANMGHWNPAQVMALLQSAAIGADAADAGPLTAAGLAGQEDAAAAAWLLMSALADTLRKDGARNAEPST